MKFLPFALCFLATVLFAQSSTEFTHTFDSKPSTGTLSAKDFWIAIPQIYNTGDSGKYAEIYIATQKATTIHIRGNKFAPVDRKLEAGEQFIFKVETQDTGKTMETRGSAVIQNKGIHLWSDGVDLSVYAYIRNAVSAGGTIILPVTSWGTEYVVVGYESEYYHGYHPGEFTLVAAEDATEVTITPSADIRDNFGYELHMAGKPFSVTLNRGQTIQYIHTGVGDSPADLTGTVITSDKPIGVTSAVQSVSIPFASTGFDFICEMMPPVCAWGRTYRTTGFHQGSSGEIEYKIIGSKEFQSIYANGGGEIVVDKYKVRSVNYYGSVLWESDAPFMLVSYLSNTPSYQLLHPAMVCVSPGEHYARELFFQIPRDTTKNWVDIAFDTAARLTTTIDGIPIAGIVTGKMKNYQINSVGVSGGVHILKSTAPVSMYAYGSNTINSFAWGGGINTSCVAGRDTVPPVAVTKGDCNSATVTFSDIHPNASRVAFYVIDSLENLKFIPSPSFVQGTPTDSFFYRLEIDNVSEPGTAFVVSYDAAGNSITVKSHIDARPNPSGPAKIVIPYAGSVPNFRTFNLMNTTITPLVLSGSNGLRFANGNQGFSLVAPDLNDLPVDSIRTFLVSYQAPDSLLRRDTIVFGDECTFLRIPLESKDVGPIAGVAGIDFGCLTVGTSREDVLLISNKDLFELTIGDVSFDDVPSHFTVISPALPVTVQPNKVLGVTVRYTPDAVDTNCAIASISTAELGVLKTSVCGCGLSASSVKAEPASNREELLRALKSSAFAWLPPVPSPVDRGESIRFTFGLARSTRVGLDLFDVDGRRVYTFEPKDFTSGIHEILLSTQSFSTGSFMYRYTVDGLEYAGKVSIR